MESLLQLLRYLDTHPHLYHSTCWLAYCGFAAYLVLFCSDRLQRHRWLASDVFFAAILGIVLLIFRWPGLFYNGELNPDESFEIVAARRLLQHPVFGTGVDGGTAGPLNFYLLCILPLVGLKIDYLSARLVGLVIVWMAVFVQYRTVSLFADRRVARLSIAPLATFFAFSTFWDFVHLSTEHLSLLLFSLGAFLLASVISRPDRDPKLEVFGLGLVAGMLPMAKLQSILLSIALLICAVVWILRKSRQNSLISPKALLTGLVLGAMCVPVGFVLFTTLTGGFAEFFRTFILMNMFYSTEIKEIPSLALLMNFVVFGSQGPGFLAFLLGGLGFAAYSFGVAPAGRKTTLLFGTTLFWCVVALVTAILPGRPSGHYLLYVVSNRSPRSRCVRHDLDAWRRWRISPPTAHPKSSSIVFWSSLPRATNCVANIPSESAARRDDGHTKACAGAVSDESGAESSSGYTGYRESCPQRGQHRSLGIHATLLRRV